MPRRGTGATGRRLVLAALAASGTLASLSVAAGASPSGYQLAAIAAAAVQAGLLALLAESPSKKNSNENLTVAFPRRYATVALHGVGVFQFVPVGG